MARQDFLNGGYYGKLGETVGQRWKNKRTIRRYVVTTNPSTDEQQANRVIFKKSINLSQQAMNLNKGIEDWKRDDLTEWQWRVSVAKRRLQAGKSEAEALPLFPEEIVTEKIILVTGIKSHEMAGVTVDIDASRLDKPVEFRMSCSFFDGDINHYSQQILTTTITPSTTEIEFEDSGYEAICAPFLIEGVPTSEDDAVYSVRPFEDFCSFPDHNAILVNPVAISQDSEAAGYYFRLDYGDQIEPIMDKTVDGKFLYKRSRSDYNWAELFYSLDEITSRWVFTRNTRYSEYVRGEYSYYWYTENWDEDTDFCLQRVAQWGQPID